MTVFKLSREALSCVKYSSPVQSSGVFFVQIKAPPVVFGKGPVFSVVISSVLSFLPLLYDNVGIETSNGHGYIYFLSFRYCKQMHVVG